MDWRNADDEKPTKDTMVLVYLSHGSINLACWKSSSKSWKTKDSYWVSHKESSITHWAYIELP